MVTVGSDTTYTTASSGKTRKGGIGLLGEAIADYYVTDRKAESACDAVGGDDRWALAEVWKQFSVSGSNRRFANLTLSGDWRTAWSAFGSGSSRVRLRLFLWDKTNSTLVDQFTVLDKGGQIISFSTNNNTYSRNLSGYLYPGRTYQVGVRAETWATALGTGTGTADIHRSGNFNGYIRFNRIVLDWI